MSESINAASGQVVPVEESSPASPVGMTLTGCLLGSEQKG